ncbi:uncharacterized protein [Nicotiana tomentosiformis]|uniref:uncharacterized protein n=1 Tax=Nicotiana tomentosiformis TaxID=4098 RepID=UPI00087821FA|nr:uncharacterized protein LOC108947361 [Nicotiana tomentosiformis]
MWCHYEIAYLIVVIHWILMELIHYEEDITHYSPVYKILMMLSCWVVVPNSKVLMLHQLSKVLALFADKNRWKSKAPTHLLKLDKGVHCLSIMDESKLKHDNACYVLIVYMLGRSSQLVHAGNNIYEAAEFMDMDLLVVGVNMKPFRGLSKVGFQIVIYSLQHYSSSTADLVVYLKFSSLPFDPATLWDDWIYSEGKPASCVVFTIAMCKDARLVERVVASQCFDLYLYDPGIQILLPNTYGPVRRKEVVANVLLGGVCTYYSVKLLPRPKELSATAANFVEAPEDAGWMTLDHRYINKKVQHSFNHFIPSVRWRDLFSMAIISVMKLKLREMPYPMLILGMGKRVVHIEIRLICVALSCAFLCTDARVMSHYIKLVADAFLCTLRYDIRLLSLMADIDFRHYIITPRTRCEGVAVNCLFAVDSVKRILL